MANTTPEDSRKPPATARFPDRALADRLIADGNRAEDAGDIERACRLYREAIAADPGHAAAHLNLGIALFAAGDAAGALASHERALAIDPQHPFVNYNLALVAQSLGEMPRADACLRTALAAKPDFFEARILEAHVRESQGKPDAAADSLRAALRLRPDHAGAHRNLGAVLEAQGRFDAAILSYEKALSIAPDDVEAHLHLANLYRSRRRFDDAIASYRNALARRPDFAGASYDLGTLLQMQGEFEEAAACMRATLALQPRNAEAHNNLGIALHSQGRLDEAVACFRQALSIDPDFAGAWCNLGGALQLQQNVDEAIVCYRKAIQFKPDLAEAHFNLGNMCDGHEALGHYRAALAARPEYAEARWALAIAEITMTGTGDATPDQRMPRIEKVLADLDDWFDDEHVQFGVNAVGTRQPFMLAYRETNNRDVLARYGRLCVRLMKYWQDKEGLTPRPSAPASTIRIGIVSAHVRDHSVWNAIVRGWFAHLDRARFSLHVFHVGVEADEETQFARAHAAYFAQGAKGIRQWTDAILGQQLDVIIYPEIGMDPVTVKLASLRLAPVQAATWGHPETTGLPTIDYYLSAECLEPTRAQDNYTERLVNLPHLGCCYRSLPVASVPPDLVALGLEADRPLFICAGAPFKYAPQHDAIFVRIAQRLGRCQFAFSMHIDESAAARLRLRLESVFARAGLNFHDYGVFLPWLPRPAFFGLMARADVYLDTIGFSGFNTAMQAIECALPVVTREGRFMRGRLASGILDRMGMPDLAAKSDDEYIGLAVRLAEDADFRDDVRRRIEATRRVLFDDTAPIRALENFLTDACRPH